MIQDTQVDNCCARRVRLTGTVAGVDASCLVSDADTILVGADLGCDMTVADPLIPAKAFRLRHIKQHAGPNRTCNSYWLLETLHDTRVFLNGCLTERDRISFGDTLVAGCHHFVFERDDAAPRDRKVNIDIADICARLTAAVAVPTAFLRNCPEGLAKLRMKQATKWAILAALLLAIIFRLVPRQPTYMDVQPAIEVVMIGEITAVPSPDSIRSLEEVERMEIEEAEARDVDPELATRPDPKIDRTDSDFMPTDVLNSTPAKPLELAAQRISSGPALSPLTVANVRPGRVQVSRSAAKLTRSVPRRRLTVTEAANPVVRKELGNLNVRIQQVPMARAGFRSRSDIMKQAAEKPTEVVSRMSDDERLAMLAGYQPSPLKFEAYRGTRIPVARMPSKLTAIAVSADDPGVQFDGKVSQDEMSISWKSGQFKIHGPNPQKANPATFCYVGKTSQDGKEYLYVSFVCQDPNVDAIVTGLGGGPHLCWDDSVELFFDHNFDRADYYHMIVNAKGQYWAAYCANGEIGINGLGRAWQAGALIKTQIDRAAKRWTAEILIPFSSFGGVPREGSRWAVNFTRAFRGQRVRPDSVYQNWFLVYTGNQTNYHHPGLFGVFQW